MDVTLTIGSYFLNNVENIILDVAEFCFGLGSGDILFSQPGTARLLHSYSYISHLGRIYTNRDWETMVDIEMREWYAHEYASFADDSGITKTAILDRIPENGYGPIKEEYRAHYSDDTWIYNTALEIYTFDLQTYCDAWTHSIPYNP